LRQSVSFGKHAMSCKTVLATLLVIPLLSYLILCLQSPAHLWPQVEKALEEAFKDYEVRKGDELEAINIALVSCGSKKRWHELEVALKSILVTHFAPEEDRSPLNFILFTDSLQNEAAEFLREWNSTKVIDGKIALDARKPPSSQVIDDP